MSTATIAPAPFHQFFDGNGDPLNGGLLYTYLSGGSTPTPTYQDAAFASQHQNPIQMDTAGRPPAPIFLDALAYKFVLKTSGGTTVWTADGVQSIAMTVASLGANGVCDGRLTGYSGLPEGSNDQATFATVYFTPFNGNKISLYNGSGWQLYSFAETWISAVPDAADTNYDVFGYLSSGTLALEKAAWSVSTGSLTQARATSLSRQDGVLVKSTDATRRYLGTYRTTATPGQVADRFTQRFIWNMYNRIRKPLQKLETTDSWTYTTDTWRSMNNSTANRVEALIGLTKYSMLDLVVYGAASNSTNLPTVAVGIGEDVTNAVLDSPTDEGTVIGRGQDIPVTGQQILLSACYRGTPFLGYHFYQALERSSASGTTTWYGDRGGTTLQAGLIGSIEC